MGKPFNNRRFSDPGLPDQNRVVFGFSRQDADHRADLGVASDDRIKLAVAGQLDQILTVLCQCIVSAFRIVGGAPLTAADGFQRF